MDKFNKLYESIIEEANDKKKVEKLLSNIPDDSVANRSGGMEDNEIYKFAEREMLKSVEVYDVYGGRMSQGIELTITKDRNDKVKLEVKREDPFGIFEIGFKTMSDVEKFLKKYMKITI